MPGKAGQIQADMEEDLDDVFLLGNDQNEADDRLLIGNEGMNEAGLQDSGRISGGSGLNLPNESFQLGLPGNLINNRLNNSDAIDQSIVEGNNAPLVEGLDKIPDIGSPEYEEEGGSVRESLAAVRSSDSIRLAAARKGSKKKKSKKLTSDDRKAHNQMVAGMKEADNAMREVKGWNYTPVTRERSKPGKWRRFWDRFSAGAARVTKAVTNVVTAPVVAIYNAVAKKRLKNAEKTMQAVKKYDEIPGWEGAVFDKKKDESGLDILRDNRRVPTVWSYITAGKAVEEDGSAVPPEVSVFVDQPKEGSSRSLSGIKMGHTMIGLNYTRLSRVSRRAERYSIIYGFYPAGGFTSPFSAIMMASENAYSPGQLIDDRTHPYTISRRYKATMKQLSDIVKASETYAEGGYGFFKRNCTTFARDMIVSVAGLDTGGKIFEEETTRFNFRTNFLRGLGGIVGSFPSGTENSRLAELSKKDDTSYQGYGNKRVTKTDVDNYNRTRSTSGFINDLFGSGRKGYAPGVTGENLRRIHNDWDTNGVLSSYKYAGNMGKKADEVSYDLDEYVENLRSEGNLLRISMNNLLADKRDLPPQLEAFIGGFNESALAPLVGIQRKMDDYYANLPRKNDEAGNPIEPDRDVGSVATRDDIRRIHENLINAQKNVSLMFTKYFKGDRRLDSQVMKYLSIIQIGLTFMDLLYSHTAIDKKGVESYVNPYDALYINKGKITVGDYTVEMTPSLYEGYLQVYKSPALAVEKYSRYKELSERKSKSEDKDNKEGVEKLSRAEKREHDNLSRLDTLAHEFSKSHQYMLERKTYSDQDIDYIYRLAELEKKDDADYNGLFERHDSAAGIYQKILFKDLFSGFGDFINGAEAAFGKPLKEICNLSLDDRIKAVSSWVRDFFVDTVNKNFKRFTALFRSLKKYKTDANDDEILMEYFLTFWNDINNSYSESQSAEKAQLALSLFSDGFNSMVQDPSSTLYTYFLDFLHDAVRGAGQ